MARGHAASRSGGDSEGAVDVKKLWDRQGKTPPAPRHSCMCLCCGVLVALLLCANVISVAPFLFRFDGRDGRDGLTLPL